jgi:hypothetical protein
MMDTHVHDDHNQPTLRTPQHQSNSSLDPFPLLKLPAELRICVYEFALTRSDPILLGPARKNYLIDPDTSAPPHDTRNDTSSSSSNSNPLNTALLRVNHQIYYEARTVLYGRNIFQINAENGMETIKSLLPHKRLVLQILVTSQCLSSRIIPEFLFLAKWHIRYFRNLHRLVLDFSEEASLKEDRMIPDQIEIDEKKFNGARIACALSYVPMRTIVSAVGEDYSDYVTKTREGSMMDQVIEDAVIAIIKKQEMQMQSALHENGEA